MAVVKIVNLIGSSPKGWEDATKNALAEAAKTIWIVKWLNVPDAGLSVLSAIS